ncbi:MAG: hypothetical protein ACTIKT_11370, partial [Microbacterium sp.]
PRFWRSSREQADREPETIVIGDFHLGALSCIPSRTKAASALHYEAHRFRARVEPDADQIARLTRHFLQRQRLRDRVEFWNPDVPPSSFGVDGHKVRAGSIRVWHKRDTILDLTTRVLSISAVWGS